MSIDDHESTLESMRSRWQTGASTEAPKEKPMPNETTDWRAEAAKLRAGLDRIMIAGNHLASALIGTFGAGEEFPAYGTSTEEARAIIKDPDQMDLWICWREIMQVRDSLRLAPSPEAPRPYYVFKKGGLCPICHCSQTLPVDLQLCACECHHQDRAGKPSPLVEAPRPTPSPGMDTRTTWPPTERYPTLSPTVETFTVGDPAPRGAEARGGPNPGYSTLRSLLHFVAKDLGVPDEEQATHPVALTRSIRAELARAKESEQHHNKRAEVFRIAALESQCETEKAEAELKALREALELIDSDCAWRSPGAGVTCHWCDCPPQPSPEMLEHEDFCPVTISRSAIARLTSEPEAEGGKA